MTTSPPRRPIRIANCSGFFGDRLSAAKEMVDGGPIDVLTGDWLAELTMLILHKQRSRNSALGYAGTFVTQMEQVLTTCIERGIKVVTNAGGLNPAGCAEKVREVLESRYDIDGFPYNSSGSIGITVFPRGDERVDDLLREADTAMYRAKAGGRNRIEFFEAAMQTEVEERLAIEHDMQDGIDAGQFALHIQPQVDARGAVVGGELLLRWTHPVRGAVPPNQFIPLAEESALILRLGDFVLQRGCEALAQLQRSGHALALSVNVSPRQFRRADFVDRVRDALQRSGARAEGLILEVTEGLLIENWTDTVSRMEELVAMGLRFSIDDFGTGYSSLAYLKKLPLYELKIDRTFVRDTPDDPNDTAIVEAILSVSKHLGLRVVAEGVETREQADFLRSRGCDCLQGYFFGRPEPLQGWLDAQRPPTPAP